MNNEYKLIEIKKLPKSEIEIFLSIEWEKFQSWRKKAIDSLKKEANIDGFRKGAVPEEIIISKIGEGGIIEEGISLWAKENILNIIKENKIEAVTPPKIHITKAVTQNPIELKMIFEIWPTFDLPDYKKIAGKAKKEIVKTEDKEVVATLEEMNKWQAWQEADKKGEKVSKEDVEKNLPPIDDAFAKKMGEENLEKLKEKIKGEILKDKEAKAKQKRASEIVGEIIKESRFEIPETMIEEEIDRIESEMSFDLERMGLSLEKYLGQIKKSRDQFRQDLKESAEKRAKSRLVIIKIAQKENIKAEEKEVNEKTEEVLKHNPKLDKENTKNYFQNALVLEKAWKFIEEI